MGIVSRSGLLVYSAVDALLAAEGLKGETWDRAVGDDVFVPATGVMRAASVPLAAGVTVTNMVGVTTVAGVGMTNGWYALYNSSLALVAQTANSPASFQAIATVLLPFTATFLVPTTDIYYAAFLGTTGTSMPTFTANTATGTTSQDAIGTGKRRVFMQAGLAALPNPAVPASASSSIWLGLT